MRFRLGSVRSTNRSIGSDIGIDHLSTTAPPSSGLKQGGYKNTKATERSSLDTPPIVLRAPIPHGGALFLLRRFAQQAYMAPRPSLAGDAPPAGTLRAKARTPDESTK